MSSSEGGAENSKLVPGSTNSFDILNLEGGVSYIVKVTALMGNREGDPVSITVTTRKSYLIVYFVVLRFWLSFKECVIF